MTGADAYSFGAFVGQFCLLAGLRAQVAPGRESEFTEVSEKRSADPLDRFDVS